MNSNEKTHIELTMPDGHEFHILASETSSEVLDCEWTTCFTVRFELTADVARQIIDIYNNAYESGISMGKFQKQGEIRLALGLNYAA